MYRLSYLISQVNDLPKDTVLRSQILEAIVSNHVTAINISINLRVRKIQILIVRIYHDVNKSGTVPWS